MALRYEVTCPECGHRYFFIGPNDERGRQELWQFAEKVSASNCGACGDPPTELTYERPFAFPRKIVAPNGIEGRGRGFPKIIR